MQMMAKKHRVVTEKMKSCEKFSGSWPGPGFTSFVKVIPAPLWAFTSCWGKSLSLLIFDVDFRTIQLRYHNWRGSQVVKNFMDIFFLIFPFIKDKPSHFSSIQFIFFSSNKTEASLIWPKLHLYAGLILLHINQKNLKPWWEEHWRPHWYPPWYLS